MKMVEGTGGLRCEEELRERGKAVQPREKARGDLTNVFKYLKRELKQGTGHELKHRRFLLNVRRHFFTVRKPSAGRGCSKELWSLPPWRCSKAI